MDRIVRYTAAGQGVPDENSPIANGPLPVPGKPTVYRARAYENGVASPMRSFAVGEPGEDWGKRKLIGMHCMVTLFKFQQDLGAWYAKYERYFNTIQYHCGLDRNNSDLAKLPEIIANHDKYCKRAKWSADIVHGSGGVEDYRVILDLAFSSPSALRLNGKVVLFVYQMQASKTDEIKWIVEQCGRDWDDILLIAHQTYKYNTGGSAAIDDGGTFPVSQQMSDLLFEEFNSDGYLGFLPNPYPLEYQRSTGKRFKKWIVPAIMYNYSSEWYTEYGMQNMIDHLEEILAPKPADRVDGVFPNTANDLKENTALMPFNDIGIEGMSSLVGMDRQLFVGQSTDMCIPATNQDGALEMCKPYFEALEKGQETVIFDKIRVFAAHMLHFSGVEPRKTPNKFITTYAPQVAAWWDAFPGANPFQHKPTANLRINNDNIIEIAVQTPEDGYRVRFGSWTSPVLPIATNIFKRPITAYGKQKITLLKGSKIVWTGLTTLPVEADPSMGQWRRSFLEVNQSGLPPAAAPKWNYDKKNQLLSLVGPGNKFYFDDQLGPIPYTEPIKITESKRVQCYKGYTSETDTESESDVAFSPAIKL